MFNTVPIIFINSLSLRINPAFSLTANLSEIIIYIQILGTKMKPGFWRRDGTTPVQNSRSCRDAILIHSNNSEFILPQSHINIILSSPPNLPHGLLTTPVTTRNRCSRYSPPKPSAQHVLHI